MEEVRRRRRIRRVKEARPVRTSEEVIVDWLITFPFVSKKESSGAKLAAEAAPGRPVNAVAAEMAEAEAADLEVRISFRGPADGAYGLGVLPHRVTFGGIFRRPFRVQYSSRTARVLTLLRSLPRIADSLPAE